MQNTPVGVSLYFSVPAQGTQDNRGSQGLVTWGNTKERVLSARSRVRAAGGSKPGEAESIPSSPFASSLLPALANAAAWSLGRHSRFLFALMFLRSSRDPIDLHRPAAAAKAAAKVGKAGRSGPIAGTGTSSRGARAPETRRTGCAPEVTARRAPFKERAGEASTMLPRIPRLSFFPGPWSSWFRLAANSHPDPYLDPSLPHIIPPLLALQPAVSGSTALPASSHAVLFFLCGSFSSSSSSLSRWPLRLAQRTPSVLSGRGSYR